MKTYQRMLEDGGYSNFQADHMEVSEEGIVRLWNNMKPPVLVAAIFLGPGDFIKEMSAEELKQDEETKNAAKGNSGPTIVPIFTPQAPSGDDDVS